MLGLTTEVAVEIVFGESIACQSERATERASNDGRGEPLDTLLSEYKRAIALVNCRALKRRIERAEL